MRHTHGRTQTYSSSLKIIVLGAILMSPTVGMASDLSGHSQSQSSQAGSTSTGESLSLGHRHIEGTVEDVNENTIKVDAGEAGEMSPRYLNFENNNSNEDLRKGDLLQLEINAQNKVVNFKKIEAQTKGTNR